jgi:hypothetical protein
LNDKSKHSALSKAQKYKNAKTDIFYAYTERDKLNEKISFGEFQRIRFPFPLPSIIADLVKYLTNYQLFKEPKPKSASPHFFNFDEE